jgi:hypothetical protein
MKKLPKPQKEYEEGLMAYREEVKKLSLEELVYELFTFLDYEEQMPNSKYPDKPTHLLCSDKEIMGPLYTLVNELRKRVGA